MPKCRRATAGDAMNKQATIADINRYKIIAIVRGVTGEALVETAEALYEGGIRLLEITFDQTGKISATETAEMIAELCRRFAGRMRIGAGTVMTAEQARIAFEAGAEYMISPDTSREVIEETIRLGAVSIPGALTPTEVATAHAYGADFVKLFPAGDLGLSYIKSIRAPLAHIPMLAVGGVNEKNLGEFLSAGLSGVGIGSNIVNKKLIDNGDFAALTALAKQYTEQV